jgi:hypothetical protein
LSITIANHWIIGLPERVATLFAADTYFDLIVSRPEQTWNALTNEAKHRAPGPSRNFANLRSHEGAEMLKRNPHLLIDDRKLWIAQAVLKAAKLSIIRARSLANLQRWKAKGTWGPVYDEWWEIMTNASDRYLIDVMTGECDEANRLRQSMPYTGIIDEKTRLEIYARYQDAQRLNGEL